MKSCFHNLNQMLNKRDAQYANFLAKKLLLTANLILKSSFIDINDLQYDSFIKEYKVCNSKVVLSKSDGKYDACITIRIKPNLIKYGNLSAMLDTMKSVLQNSIDFTLNVNTVVGYHYLTVHMISN